MCSLGSTSLAFVISGYFFILFQSWYILHREVSRRINIYVTNTLSATIRGGNREEERDRGREIMR